MCRFVINLITEKQLLILLCIFLIKCTAVLGPLDSCVYCLCPTLKTVFFSGSMLLGMRGLQRWRLRVQRHLQILWSRICTQQEQNWLRQAKGVGYRLAQPLGACAANFQLLRHPVYSFHNVRVYPVQQNACNNGLWQRTLLCAVERGALLLLDVIHNTCQANGGNLRCYASWSRSVSQHLLQRHFHEN